MFYSTVHVSAEFDNAISIVEEMLKNFDEVSSILFKMFLLKDRVLSATK